MKLWYLVRYAKNGTAKIHENKNRKSMQTLNNLNGENFVYGTEFYAFN